MYAPTRSERARETKREREREREREKERGEREREGGGRERPKTDESRGMETLSILLRPFFRVPRSISILP